MCRCRCCGTCAPVTTSAKEQSPGLATITASPCHFWVSAPERAMKIPLRCPVLRHPPYVFQWPWDAIVPLLAASCACHVFLVPLVHLSFATSRTGWCQWFSSSWPSCTLPSFTKSLRLPTGDIHSSMEALTCKCKFPSDYALPKIVITRNAIFLYIPYKPL